MVLSLWSSGPINVSRGDYHPTPFRAAPAPNGLTLHRIIMQVGCVFLLHAWKERVIGGYLGRECKGIKFIHVDQGGHGILILKWWELISKPVR